MQIDSAELFRVPGDSAAGCESIFVALTSGGATGWGEASLAASPRTTSEWSAGAFLCLRDWLAPAIVGQSIDSGDSLQNALAAFQGNARAKSALDLAWWSLAATKRGVALERLLGAQRNEVLLARRVALRGSLDELLADVNAGFAAGCASVVLEMRPGWDIEMLRAVRRELGTQSLSVDCDGSYTLAAQEMFYRLEDFFLDSIEQPLAADDLVGHAMLQESLRTPIALDQTITSLERAEQAIDLGACRRVKIDLAAVGGLTAGLAIAKSCQEASIPWSVNLPRQRMPASAALALATVATSPQPAEFSRFESPRFFSGASPLGCDEPVGSISLSEIPGGISLDRKSLLEAAVEHAAIG